MESAEAKERYSQMRKKSSIHRYLQKIGLSYYVRVKVPNSLQDVVGNTHIRRALHTRDLDTANRMKWQHVEAIKAYLNRLKGLDPLNMKAQKFRESIRQPIVKGNYEEADELKLIAIDDAEKIEEATGNYKRAKEWYDLATSEEHTLDELVVDVNAALDEVMRGRTTFVIAHRLSTIRKATRILVFENGRVVESGTFD